MKMPLTVLLLLSCLGPTLPHPLSNHSYLCSLLLAYPAEPVFLNIYGAK
jgi:hypothetical protein